MKDWDVNFRTYNSFGGHKTLSLLAPFFLKDLPDFGPALQELSTTFHFGDPGPPMPTLEDMFRTFHIERTRLPKVIFQRSRQKAQIDFASEIMAGLDLHWSSDYKTEWFNRGAYELVQNLTLLRVRFTPKDNFDVEAFLVHCTNRLSDLPSDQVAFSALVQDLEAREKAWRISLSGWDRLGIDFRDFHPEARRILDDPFFWDPTDDFAPNGNDIGADVLGDYQEWLQHNNPKDAPEFLSNLLSSWGVEQHDLVSQQAIIGMAFAELKLTADCHPVIRKGALEALDLQAAIVEDHATENATIQEWIRRIGQLKSKLQS